MAQPGAKASPGSSSPALLTPAPAADRITPNMPIGAGAIAPSVTASRVGAAAHPRPASAARAAYRQRIAHRKGSGHEGGGIQRQPKEDRQYGDAPPCRPGGAAERRDRNGTRATRGPENPGGHGVYEVFRESGSALLRDGRHPQRAGGQNGRGRRDRHRVAHVFRQRQRGGQSADRSGGPGRDRQRAYAEAKGRSGGGCRSEGGSDRRVRRDQQVLPHQSARCPRLRVLEHGLRSRRAGGQGRRRRDEHHEDPGREHGLAVETDRIDARRIEGHDLLTSGPAFGWMKLISSLFLSIAYLWKYQAIHRSCAVSYLEMGRIVSAWRSSRDGNIDSNRSRSAGLLVLYINM